MATLGEVDAFEKRVQEALNVQREKIDIKYKDMLGAFQRAINEDGLPRIDDDADNPVRIVDDSDTVELVILQDHAGQVVEEQSTNCAYVEIFNKLYSKHTQQIKKDMAKFYTEALGKLKRKAGQFGHKNTKADEEYLLQLGRLTTGAEWQNETTFEKKTVTISAFLRKNLPDEYQEYANSLKKRYAADLKQAKIDQLRSRPHPKPMLKRQNGYLGFVYTTEDESLMMDVMNRSNFEPIARRVQERILKRKI